MRNTEHVRSGQRGRKAESHPATYVLTVHAAVTPSLLCESNTGRGPHDPLHVGLCLRDQRGHLSPNGSNFLSSTSSSKTRRLTCPFAGQPGRLLLGTQGLEATNQQWNVGSRVENGGNSENDGGVTPAAEQGSGEGADGGLGHVRRQTRSHCPARAAARGPTRPGGCGTLHPTSEWLQGTEGQNLVKKHCALLPGDPIGHEGVVTQGVTEM